MKRVHRTARKWRRRLLNRDKMWKSNARRVGSRRLDLPYRDRRKGDVDERAS